MTKVEHFSKTENDLRIARRRGGVNGFFFPELVNSFTFEGFAYVLRRNQGIYETKRKAGKTSQATSQDKTGRDKTKTMNLPETFVLTI
jgi:hypothetical protein